MPNWCNNTIDITGPANKIRTLWQRSNVSNENTGLLNSMVPMPEQLHGTTKGSGDENQVEKYDGFTNWYDWSVARWGTKWEIDTEGLEYTENADGTATISGWFDSAWAPPITACATYCEENPDVSIVLDYHEPGMCFVGRATIQGEDVDDDYYEYSEATSKTVRDVIGEEMDDFWCISENMAEWEEENEEEDA